MTWRWKLGRFAGIDVYIHATFLLLLAWVGLGPVYGGRGGAAAADGILFTLSIFLCVVLHEYGHALTARRFGIGTRDITLYPIGGVARLERMPEKPSQELLVALAGPAVNVVIAAILFVALKTTDRFVPLAQVGGGEAEFMRVPFLERIFFVNISLVVFNMLPAFPMDGGRVVRALLASRLEYAQATRIAANLGQSMAFLMGLAGFFYNPMLMVLALFVWIAAAQENGMVQMKSILGGLPVGHAIITEFHRLSPSDTLARAVEFVLSSHQQDFPVVHDGVVIGMLTRRGLIEGLHDHGKDLPVAQVMDRQFDQIEAGEPLESAMARLGSRTSPTLPVTSHGRLVGLLNAENVSEFLMIRSALQAGGTSVRPR